MARKILVLIVFVVVALAVTGCQTAEGLKEDAQFIGDKTYEIVDQ
jgi:predicted small secreted protein